MFSLQNIPKTYNLVTATLHFECLQTCEWTLTIFLQELQGIIKTLLTHATEDFWLRREQGMRDAVEVGRSKLDAGTGYRNVCEIG